ncbi:hypothetical protein sos41_08120 [Alphaproteobacteria bacterium SO-S41]|nr:hypothetical protein sos41_08120 [Alphaproteobacteria bacterium SO-S41]
MKLRHRIGFAVLGLALAGCTAPAKTSIPAPSSPETSSEAPVGPPPPTAAEQAECDEQGGEVKRVGLMGAYACVIPYTDAGKVCANDSDCEGACWISGHPAGPDPKARGTCQPTNMPFGCYGTLDKAVVTPEMCAD